MKKLVSKNYLNNSVHIISLILISCLACNLQKNEKYQINEGIDSTEIDIVKLRDGYIKGDFTIREITQIYLDRIQMLDFSGPELGSIIQINPDAIEIALKLDQEMDSGNDRGPLHGIPIVLKDNINTNDKMNTTAGSRALAN